jgi:predicted  nucleic acid-binding Zn-ribbon protein
MTNEIKEILDLFYNEYSKEEKTLEKYITNLQNEIFDLKDTIQNKNDCIGAYECIIEDRDKRIDKAVEYIEENWYKSFLLGTWEFFGSGDELLNILRGDE